MIRGLHERASSILLVLVMLLAFGAAARSQTAPTGDPTTCREPQVLKFRPDTSSYWTACGEPTLPLVTEEAQRRAGSCREAPHPRGTNTWFLCDVRIPPPPLIILPLAEIEPPRNQAAENWQSPYCMSWNDGCTKCRRADLASPTICERYARPNENCAPRTILCQGTRTPLISSQFCKEESVISYDPKKLPMRRNQLVWFTDTSRWRFAVEQWMWELDGELFVKSSGTDVVSQNVATANDRDLSEQIAADHFASLGVEPAQESRRLGQIGLSDHLCRVSINLDNAFKP